MGKFSQIFILFGLLGLVLVSTMLVFAQQPDNDGDGVPDDSDVDGVPDDSDVCRLIIGTEPNGCPPTSVPLFFDNDADGDGFLDQNDQCPTIAGPFNGCDTPFGDTVGDNDNDGVVDELDMCRNTGGDNVDLDGCPIEDSGEISFDAPQNLSQSPIIVEGYSRRNHGQDVDAGRTTYSVDGNTIHFVWVDGDDGNPNEDTLMYGSIVNGMSSTPVEIEQVIPGFGYRISQATISASGSVIDVVFNEETGNFNAETSHTRSTDNGQTWSTPFPLQTANEFMLNLFVDGDEITVFYNDNDVETFFVRQSTDGGVSFGTPVEVTTNSVSSSVDFITDIVKNDGIYHVLFSPRDTTSGSILHLLYTNSDTNTATWNTPVELSILSGDDEIHSGQLFIDQFDPDVMTVVMGLRNNDLGFSEALTSFSTNGGVDWTTPNQIWDDAECDNVQDAGNKHRLIAREGESIYIVCTGGVDALYEIHSNNLGNDWSDPRQITTPNSGVSTGNGESIVSAHGNNVYILFEQEDSLGLNHYYLIQSSNRAESFDLGSDVIELSLGENTDIQDDAFPTIVTETSNDLYVVYRNGDDVPETNDIFSVVLVDLLSWTLMVMDLQI